jgi:hypothetical protein
MPRGAVALCALCLLGVTAHPAAAAAETLGTEKGLVYRLSEAAVGTSGDGAFASCKGEQAPLGGGAFISGPAGQGLLTQLEPLSPSPTDVAGFDAEAYTLSGTQTLSSYGICRKAGGAGVTYRSRVDEDVPHLSVGGGDRECPSGTRPSGGGGGTGAGQGSWINASVLLGGGSPRWGLIGRNFTGAAVTMRVDVVCVRPTVAKLKRRQEIEKNVAVGDVGHPIARCPAGSSVVGGGGAAGSEAQAWVNGSGPWDGPDADAVPADGWEAFIYNESGAAKDAIAQAICKA